MLGLGRFGVSVVKTLSEYDVDVLACDKDPARLHEATPYATHVIQVDLNDEMALQQLGLGNFDVVILAMGEDFEASILTTMMAKEQGAPTVVAKARGLRQKKILEGVGADVVILPLHDVLCLGKESRINFPSTVSTENWSYRFEKRDLKKSAQIWLKRLTEKYDR